MNKVDEPQILRDNHTNWLSEYLADKDNSTKRYRYRHPDIKLALKRETGNKCVYCESMIGHNSPGDIEHKIPSSKEPLQHFIWDNLTIACTECNRRKNDYYDENTEFLDPYNHDVESALEHYGPLVYWKSTEQNAEVSIRILELNSSKRQILIERKIARIEEFSHLIERFLTQENQTLKELLWRQIEEMTDVTSEYSAMLKEIVEKKGIEKSSTSST